MIGGRRIRRYYVRLLCGLLVSHCLALEPPVFPVEVEDMDRCSQVKLGPRDPGNNGHRPKRPTKPATHGPAQSSRAKPNNPQAPHGRVIINPCTPAPLQLPSFLTLHRHRSGKTINQLESRRQALVTDFFQKKREGKKKKNSFRRESPERALSECPRTRERAARTAAGERTRTSASLPLRLHGRNIAITDYCENSNEKRELTFKEDGQEYAQVLKMLGNGRLEAMVRPSLRPNFSPATDSKKILTSDPQCFDGVKRLGLIRGKLRKKIWINNGDIILVSLREYQDEKGDVILKYSADEARSLYAPHEPLVTPTLPPLSPCHHHTNPHSRKAYGELPDTAKINETDTFGPGEDGDCGFEFDEDRDSDSDTGGNAGGSKEIAIDDI